MQYKVFAIYVAALSIHPNDEVHLLKRAQIAHLKANKVFIKVFSEYIDFVNVFSPKLATEFPEHTEINNYAIKLIENQQSLYGLIYSLEPMELEILKAYIKNNLANNFIRPF